MADKYNLSIDILGNIDLTRISPVRGGIIIYYLDSNSQPRFVLGIDKSTDITDFGGGINYVKGENAITGSVREFREESLDVFGIVNPDDILDSVTSYSEELMIIFLHMNIPNFNIIKDKYSMKNLKLKNQGRRVELLDIIDYSIDEFIELIMGVHQDNLYTVVRTFLNESLESNLLQHLFERD